jgi:hypothetical protein
MKKNLLQYKVDGHLVDVQAYGVTELTKKLVKATAKAHIAGNWEEAILSDGKGNIIHRMKNPDFKKRRRKIMKLTYEDLQKNGEILETACEGTCQLWEMGGTRYVVLCDNTVITQEWDNSLPDPIFPL